MPPSTSRWKAANCWPNSTPTISPPGVAQAEAVVEVAKARLRHAELQVQLTQDSTSNDTVRTGATLLAARSALREAQHGAERAEAHLRTWEAAVAAAQGRRGYP